jgi:hypothetical protein
MRWSAWYSIEEKYRRGLKKVCTCYPGAYSPGNQPILLHCRALRDLFLHGDL